jgi:hypothetical protein
VAAPAGATGLVAAASIRSRPGLGLLIDQKVERLGDSGEAMANLVSELAEFRPEASEVPAKTGDFLAGFVLEDLPVRDLNFQRLYPC